MALVPSEAPGARRRPEAPGGAGPEGPGWTASAREPGSRRIIPAQRRSRRGSFHRTKLPLAAAGGHE